MPRIHPTERRERTVTSTENNTLQDLLTWNSFPKADHRADRRQEGVGRGMFVYSTSRVQLLIFFFTGECLK